MLGLCRKGARILVSEANSPTRKLKYTEEAVWLDGRDGGFWVGVNTSMPERLFEKAFRAGALPFAQGYDTLKKQVRYGQSRLDVCLSGPGVSDFFIECKNVTLVEDEVAAFPDARSLRAQKHLLTLMELVRLGNHCAMFYLVQRPDGRCFHPADYIDSSYAKLFREALKAGVRVYVYVYRALVTERGVALAEALPLSPELSSCGKKPYEENGSSTVRSERG